MPKPKDKKDRITPKQYTNNEVETVDIFNTPEYHEWVHTRWKDIKGFPDGKGAYEEYRKGQNFLADNRKVFPDLFGKRHFLVRLEFAYHCWHLEHESVDFLILTSRRGSSIEIINPKKIDPKDWDGSDWMDDLWGKEEIGWFYGGKEALSLIGWINNEIEALGV